MATLSGLEEITQRNSTSTQGLEKMADYQAERLVILEKGPMGWKSPVQALKFLAGMSGKRFDELFNLESPRVQIIDGTGDLVELTAELISRLDQLRYPVGQVGSDTGRVSSNGSSSQPAGPPRQTGPVSNPGPPPQLQRGTGRQVPMGQSTGPLSVPSNAPPGRRAISVYVAHSHLDAESLCHPFIDSISRSSDLRLYTIQPSQDSSSLRDYPKQVVAEANVVLFLLTQNSLSSYWALYELVHAIDEEKSSGIQKVLVIGYDLGPSDSDKESWRTFYRESILRNMANWESRIDTKIRQSMQEGSTSVAAALTEHRYAIARVKSSAQDIATRFVDSIHPTYSSNSGIPDSHEIEGWIKRVAA